MQVDLEKQKNEFAQAIGMDKVASQRFYDQLALTANMSNADREVEMRKLQQQYNLTEEQLAQAKAIADADRTASFWANLLGGTIGAGGKIGAALIK